MHLTVGPFFIVAGLCAALSGCVPAMQYEPLTTTALDTGKSRQLTIHSQGVWRDTGIEVRQGEIYQVYSQGTWSASPFCGDTDASGVAVEHIACMKAIFAQAFPMPDGRIGALIGRIGTDGRVFAVGETRGFIADRDGTLFLRMNDANDFIWDNVGQIEVAVQRYGEGMAPPAFAAASGGVVPPAAPVAKTSTVSSSRTASAANSGGSGSRLEASGPDPRVAGSGYFAAERDITFNVLERVEFDPATGQVSLAGRFDPNFAGPRIPYLQHLAEFLDSPGPQASLDWTPEFERRVDAFFSRMDDERAMGDLVGSGQLVDDNYRVTRKGQLFLPMFGVKAFDYGNAPGQFGANLSLKELGVLRVDSVTPGGAADRAGIAPGDEIHMVTVGEYPSQPHVVSVFTRDIRFAGAGETIKVQVGKPSGFQEVNVTLDAYPGDPWEHVEKYDILERIFRAADKPKAANLMAAVGDLLRHQNDEAGQMGFISVLFATDTLEMFYDYRERVNRGEMAQGDAMSQVSREMVRGMERAMELPYDAIVPIYDREYARTGDPFGPIDVAILELNRQVAPMFKESLRIALYKNDQITMPVAVLDETQDFQPLVTPRYINVPAGSELARLFIEADYVGKAIIHRPELSQRIPRYKTEYAFTGSRPGPVEETTNRLWIEPGRVMLKQSPSNNTLSFGQVDMKINIGRAIGGGVEHRDDAYGQYLSALYDELAREFTSLHELREAAKVAVVARWLKVRQPGYTLPKAGRAKLNPPQTLEGFVTLIWSPHSIKVSLIAPGGIDFKVPPIGPSGPIFPDAMRVNVPVDSAVVDLRDLGTGDMPKVDPAQFGAASVIPDRYRRPLTEPPPPPSVRLVGLATKGQRTLERIDAIRINRPVDAGRCDADKARALNAKLTEAAGIARQLQGAEKALNVITAQADERQRTFEEVEQTFREEQQRLRETAVDLATGGLLDAYDELKGSVKVRSIQDLETLIATMRDAQDKLDDISDKLSNLDLAISAAAARTLSEREKATEDLMDFLKDTLADGANLKGNDLTSRAMRTIGKSVSAANQAQAVADTAMGLYQINAAVERLRQADQLSEAELKGLRDSVLPLQRKLSDRLDAVMNDPDVKAYQSGDAGFDCDA